MDHASLLERCPSCVPVGANVAAAIGGFDVAELDYVQHTIPIEVMVTKARLMGRVATVSQIHPAIQAAGDSPALNLHVLVRRAFTINRCEISNREHLWGRWVYQR